MTGKHDRTSGQDQSRSVMRQTDEAVPAEALHHLDGERENGAQFAGDVQQPGVRPSHDPADDASQTTGARDREPTDTTIDPAACEAPPRPSWREMAAQAAPTFAVALAPLCALVLVSGDTISRVAAITIAFLAGALAVYLMARDERRRLNGRIAELEAERRALHQQVEETEDQAWELREAAERQASILQALGDVVVRRDMSGTVLYISPAASELFTAETMPRLGQPLSLPLADTHDSSGTAAGDVAFGDIMLMTRHGPRWFSRLDVTVRDGTRDTPLVQTLLRDVTERRIMEEELLAARNSAETASEAKSRFLATVSHEIRTPLNGILGMASLLRDTRLTPEQAAYADALTSSGETLLLLIDELLDFSRAEAGRLLLHPAPAALAPLCEQVVELLAPRAQAKGLEVSLTLAPDVPEHVTVDASRLRQILFNLTGNGVKFTETGGVSVDIAIEHGPSGTGILVIAVADTGIGFAPDDAARMFGEFEQVDHGPARRYGGTGLGLAIVQRLITLMQGSIVAEGTPGQGARFLVRLPVPEAPAAARRWPVLTNRRIAVVSSGRVEASALARHLGAHGAQLQQLLPGDPDMAEALGIADLVFLDHASVSDGAAWLAGARAAGCKSPAIVLITPTERERLERLRLAGFAAYLIRPVRSQTLERTVNAVLMGQGDARSEGDASASSASWDGMGSTATPSDQGPQPDLLKLAEANRLAPSRPLRLLLAEDNDINRLLGEALLRKLGHETLLATDGAEAVKAARSGEFDAILMDLHMPGLDGFGAIAAIRAEEKSRGAAPVPVLIVTADVMPAAREKAEGLGVLGYLTKPLSQAAVADALRQLTSRS